MILDFIIDLVGALLGGREHRRPTARQWVRTGLVLMVVASAIVALVWWRNR